MANNRMYLVCKKCDLGPEYAKSLTSQFYLAKYYPSTGWYNYDRPEYASQMNDWFEEHRHAEGHEIPPGFMGHTWGEPERRFGSMDGNEHIRLEYDIEPE